MRRLPWNVGLLPTEIAAGNRSRLAPLRGSRVHQVAGVDAVGRDRGERRALHVGRRVAHLPAAPVTADDDAVDPVRPAQRAGRRDHVAGGHAGADVGGGDGHLAVVGGVLGQRDALDGEAEPPALRGQRLRRCRPPCARR